MMRFTASRIRCALLGGLLGVCASVSASAELIAVTEGTTVDNTAMPALIFVASETKDGLAAQTKMIEEPHETKDLVAYEFDTEGTAVIGDDLNFDPTGQDAYYVSDGSGVGVAVSLSASSDDLSSATFTIGTKTLVVSDALATQGHVILVDSPVSVPEPGSVLMAGLMALGLLASSFCARKSS